ncbi:IPT/TIG domain-containing protein [uncultured Bacteroides sp.]|jgi:IPT/TIG domain protein|uniref:IPT/TIG domain-containing protein n=1 Tax=uncultured Bacteroides sp. TaxID=162156 RepID=UPI00280AEEC5|nr:IPT/TIG domain-containing protein [uncultured Bacteroides sp.]
MKSLLKNSLNVFMLIGLSALLFSCEPEGKYKEYVYPEPVVDEIYPVSGYVASQVAIIGTDFGDRAEAVKVAFGGVEAENIISCKNNRIIVEVPEGAQSGSVSLKVWTHTLESIGEYTVIPIPEITSIASDNEAGETFAEGGDELTILGNGFGSDASLVKVTINGKNAEILSVMENEVKARVPENYGSGTVVVTVRDYAVEAGALIDPSMKGDVTRLFLKNYKQPFQRATEGDEEWADALYWIKNGNFYGNSLQFPEDEPDGLLAMTGKNNMWDGALYQITSLPAGTYEFIVKVADTGTVGGRYGAQFTVMRGEGEFPGLTDKGAPWHYADEDMADILGTVLVTAGAGEYSYSVTLTEVTPLTIGFATMLANSNYVKVSEIQIIRK